MPAGQSFGEVPLVWQDDDRVDSAFPGWDKFMETSGFGIVWEFGHEALFPSLVGTTIQVFRFILLSPKGWDERV